MSQKKNLEESVIFLYTKIKASIKKKLHFIAPECVEVYLDLNSEF